MHGPRDANTDSNEEHEKKRELFTRAENSEKLQMLHFMQHKIHSSLQQYDCATRYAVNVNKNVIYRMNTFLEAIRHAS